MTALLVIADDFTGALDTGVQFASKGIRSRVITESESYTAGSSYACDVLVIDAETRHLPADEAYQKVYRIVEAAAENGISYIYKKTDSALRGNIGAELSALLEASKGEQVMFLPAYPQMRRTTQNGMHYIDSVPVAESVFGKDPFEPVRESDCRKLIALQCETPVTPAGIIHTPDDIPEEKGIVLLDAVKTDDLVSAANSLKEAGKMHLLAGCAGFASVLPDFLELPKEKQTSFSPEAEMLAVCGSMNPITITQLDYASENGFLRVRLNPEQKLDETRWHTEEGKEELDHIRAQFRNTSLRILDANDEDHGRSTSALANQRGLSIEETRRKIADSIGEALSLILGDESYGTLFITGGDTLLGCMKHMHVNELEPVCELDPGVVLSRLYRQGKECWIITKSGGFGEKDLLVRIARKLNDMKGTDMKETDNRPVIGITMGDPAGNGPEITVKALAREDLYECCRPLVIGDAKMIEQACRFVGREDLAIHRCAKVSDALFRPGTIDVYHLDLIDDVNTFEIGKVSIEGGNAAFQCVRKVIELALAHEVDATVTNALNKEAMNKALEYYQGEKSDGYTHFDGHTEIYATYTGTKKYTMMLAHHDLRVVHVSTHVSLREACDRVKKDRVLEVIEIAERACRDMGISTPRIAVAGLNPHCGENGLFGTEEIEEIIPAVNAAKEKGINAIGPIPPDSVFSEALGGWYDIVVCMYHDQGHIPLKTVGFVYDREKQNWKAVEGVNITLGLPIIRTSVDHGTGFALAGKGTSNELSLVNAIDYAIRMAHQTTDG